MAKTQRIVITMPAHLLDPLKAIAKRRGVAYSDVVREAVEEVITDQRSEDLVNARIESDPAYAPPEDAA